MLSVLIDFLSSLISSIFSIQILSQSTLIGSISDIDSDSSRSETRTMKKEEKKRINSNASSIKTDRKFQPHMSSYFITRETTGSSTKDNIDNKNIRSTTVTKIHDSGQEVLSVSTSDINDNT